MIYVDAFLAVDQDDGLFRLHFTRPERRRTYWYSKNFATLEKEDVPDKWKVLTFESEPVPVFLRIDKMNMEIRMR